MALTVADVLTMPAVRNADPVLLAGEAGLTQSVRWVHTTELADIGPLLRADDLLLTTGIALPESDEALAEFAHSLWESKAAGLLVELGRRWTAVPAALTAACDRLGLPLVALRREVKFANVAQSVGERIVDEQLTELREAQRIHETFTRLSAAEADPKQILQAIAALAGATVVMEGEHRVLDYRPGPGNPAAFLDDWERRSRAVRVAGPLAWDESNGWLVAHLGRPERAWGRLVIECPGPPSQRLVTVAERGAAALAMHRLHDHQRDSHLRRLHHELVVGLLANPADPDLEQRCGLAGLPTQRRRLVGLTLRSRTPADDVVAAVLHAAAVTKTPVLVSIIDDTVYALLSLARRTDPVRAVDGLMTAVTRRHPIVAAAGSPVDELRDSDRTLNEARQVLQAVSGDSPAVLVHRLDDVHVRGLLTLLRDDPRLRSFADRELGALRKADGRLEAALRAMLRHPTSKSDAAQSLAISRPVLYDRLAAAERILGVNLDDGETRTSLHLALLIDEITA